MARLRHHQQPRELTEADRTMLELAAHAPPEVAAELRAEVAWAPVTVGDVLRVRCMLRGGRGPAYRLWVLRMLAGRRRPLPWEPASAHQRPQEAL